MQLHKLFYKMKITLTTALRDTQGRSLMKNRFPPGMIFVSNYSRLNNLNSQASCQLLHHQDIKKIITNCINYQCLISNHVSFILYTSLYLMNFISSWWCIPDTKTFHLFLKPLHVTQKKNKRKYRFMAIIFKLPVTSQRTSVLSRSIAPLSLSVNRDTSIIESEIQAM